MVSAKKAVQISAASGGNCQPARKASTPRVIRAAGIESQNPWQQLPVATDPAMLSRQFDIVAGGKFLHQFDIRGQRGPRENAFQQIVAKDGVFGNALVQRLLK